MKNNISIASVTRHTYLIDLSETIKPFTTFSAIVFFFKHSFDMKNTHHDFKTVVNGVKDACDMEQYVGYALVHQYSFKKKTTPWEMHDDLQKFKIDLEKVDRLYYIYHTEDAGDQEFSMVARMDYKGQKLYFELDANCDYTGFSGIGGGFIFVSSDANVFMKVVLKSNFNIDCIYQSLSDDGIDFEEQNEYDRADNIFWKNPPKLKYLCHQAIYDHKSNLEAHFVNLPTILKDSVNDFIRMKDAKKNYEYSDSGLFLIFMMLAGEIS